MSIDYRLFLRDKPQLELLAADDDDEITWWTNELARGSHGTWRFGAMTLTVSPYLPRGGDELAGHPARTEIHWVIDADGRHSDLFDEWEALVEAVCTRWRGGCHSQQLGELVWYAAQARAPSAKPDARAQGRDERRPQPREGDRHLRAAEPRAPGDTDRSRAQR